MRTVHDANRTPLTYRPYVLVTMRPTLTALGDGNSRMRKNLKCSKHKNVTPLPPPHPINRYCNAEQRRNSRLEKQSLSDCRPSGMGSQISKLREESIAFTQTAQERQPLCIVSGGLTLKMHPILCKRRSLYLEGVVKIRSGLPRGSSFPSDF
ncbi:hypothetical protein K435DRAFT_781347 [Dendrothele bispora CBS 962.96]|uniref:Uncharacterized protein n=1 Tax=Dendrothele bispora (strain CBS 962.96) TaxID=1314807 RepID=A0A4S8LLT2_DENBC|nr:hypothetical protein K435DRAFT_781347 [Dendrothele bispora CBS 962.96]